VPSYRITQAARLLGVSTDTLRRWTDSGRLPVTRDSAGRRVIDGRDLANLAVSLAEDVSLGPTVRHSARNRLTGIVTKVILDGVMAQVELAAGPFRIVALISREATLELGLEVGVLAVATVKATNVSIDVPDAGVPVASST
jgi:molybdopterin-binding protein